MTDFYNSKEARTQYTEEDEHGEKIILHPINFDVDEEIKPPADMFSLRKQAVLDHILNKCDLLEIHGLLRYYLIIGERAEAALIVRFLKENNVLEETRKYLDNKSCRNCFMLELVEMGTRPTSVRFLFRSGMYNKDNVTEEEAANITFFATKFAHTGVAVSFIDRLSPELFEDTFKQRCVLFDVIRRCQSLELFKKVVKLKGGDLRCRNTDCRCKDILKNNRYDEEMGIEKLVPDAREYVHNLFRMKMFVRSRKQQEPFLTNDTLLHIFRFVVDKEETCLPSFLSLLNK